MLGYNRIDICGGIDVNKTSLLKRCDIFHYCYFKDIGFMHVPYICNCCHNLMQKAMSFNNVAIVYVKGSAYRIHFWYMSKNAINLTVLIWLIKWVFYKDFFTMYKNE